MFDDIANHLFVALASLLRRKANKAVHGQSFELRGACFSMLLQTTLSQFGLELKLKNKGWATVDCEGCNGKALLKVLFDTDKLPFVRTKGAKLSVMNLSQVAFDKQKGSVRIRGHLGLCA